MKRRSVRLACVLTSSIFCLGGSCHETETSSSPAEPEMILGWAQNEVARSHVHAESVANQNERNRMDELEQAIDAYLTSLSTSIQSFRAAVPEVGELIYDTAPTRLVLEQSVNAAENLRQLAPWLLVEEWDVLVSHARYLDDFTEALDAVDNGEPLDSPRAFVDRYSNLVQAHNTWAQATAEWIAEINEQPQLALSEATPQVLLEELTSLLEERFVDELVTTCQDWVDGNAGDNHTLVHLRALVEFAAKYCESVPEESADSCLGTIVNLAESLRLCLAAEPGTDDSSELLVAVEVAQRAHLDACVEQP